MSDKKTPAGGSPQKNKSITNKGQQHRTQVGSQKIMGYDRLAFQCLLLCVIVTFLLYIPSLFNGFVNWDDGDYVSANPIVQNLNAENLRRLITEPVAGNHHPLTMISLSLNYALSPSAEGIHVVNWLLHILNTFLVFAFAYRLSNRKPWVAMICALFFGIHPMHVESVAWVSERKDVLYVLFYLLAMMQYLHYRQGQQMRFYWFTLLFFLLSLLSKPAAVSLPFALLLIDYWQGHRLNDTKIWLQKIPFFALSIVFGLLTISAQSKSAIAEIDNYTLVQKLLFAFYGFTYYIVKLFLPFNFAAFHPYPTLVKGGALPAIYWLAPFAALLIGLGVVRSMRHSKALLFGVLFYLANIILVLQFVTVGKAIVAERYTYLAYFGLLFAIGYYLQHFCDTYPKKQNTVLMGIGAFALFCTVQSYRQIGVWNNGGTLWTQVIEQYPNCDVAFDNRGVFYRGQGKNDKALVDYNRVLQLNPKYALTYNNRGNIYFEQQKDALALADYDKAIELDPKNAEPYANRGAIHVRNQRYEQGFADYDKAEELDPDFPNLYLNKGISYAVLNKHEDAIKTFDRYLQLKPNDDGIYNSKAVSYQQLQRHQEAIADFDRAIRLNPKQGIYVQNRSFSYNALGDKARALQDALKAQSLGVAVNPEYIRSLQ